jgi:hypothetical protein
MADIALKLEHLESHDEERRLKLQEVEGRLDEQSENVDRLLRWGLDGNGTSADTRLHFVEEKTAKLSACVERVASDDTIAHIAQVVVKEVIGNARNRDKTWVAKAKAIASVLTPIGAIIAGLAALIAVLTR